MEIIPLTHFQEENGTIAMNRIPNVTQNLVQASKRTSSAQRPVSKNSSSSAKISSASTKASDRKAPITRANNLIVDPKALNTRNRGKSVAPTNLKGFKKD